jgi:hypothetical protein
LKNWWGWIGLDRQWQQDWTHNQVDCSHPDDQAELLVAYLMAMEFVHDLSTDPNSERLQRLKKKQEEYVKKSSILLGEMRKNDPTRYMKWAEQVEANLTQAECAHKPEELGLLDTFRFEADTFLKEAMTLLAQRKWDNALALARVRLPRSRKKGRSSTFWLQQDQKRRWLWEWIDVAANMGIKADQIHLEIHNQDPDILTHEELTALYTEKWWRLDQMHRKLSALSERYQSIYSDLHINAFFDIRNALRTLYRVCIDKQSVLWSRLCELKGFLPPEALQQRFFFYKWVKPMLQKKKKGAIFFVDALRFELGKELVQNLQPICSKQKISPLWAELPTITAVGMNILAPVVKDSKVTPLFDKNKTITGFQGGERQVITPADRQKTVQDHAGVETAWISLKDLLSCSDKKLKKIIDKDLLVVTALDIDKMGESNALALGNDYFENGLSRLKEAIIKLKENKFENVIITSDHGFIQGDESLETGKAPKLECVTRRYAYGPERNSKNLYSVGLNQLNYATTESDYFIFERSTHLLNNQSQASFYHGGNTLQERIVPVISFSLTKELPDSSGTFDFTIQTKTDTLGFHRISISVKSMEPKLFSPPHVEVQLISEPDIRVEIGDIVGAEHKGDIITLPLDQDSEIYFKLFNGAHSKAKIYLKSTQKATILKNNESADYFNVENYDPQHQLEKPQKRKQKDKPGATAYSDTIPSEFHAALTHLEKHGSLTEKFLVNTLGNNGIAQRKSRRFANRIAEWSNVLPFDIYIEQTAEGKEYRKK